MTNPNTDLKTLAAKLLFVLCKENGETIDDEEEKERRISFQSIDLSNTRATATPRVCSTTTVSITPGKIIIWNTIRAIRPNRTRRCTRITATTTSKDRLSLSRSLRVLHWTLSLQFGSGDRSGQFETA